MDFTNRPTTLTTSSQTDYSEEAGQEGDYTDDSVRDQDVLRNRAVSVISGVVNTNLVGSGDTAIHSQELFAVTILL